MRYESLLSRPFAIIRRRPWLLFLGLLANEFAGGGGNFNVRTSTPRAAPFPDLSWIPYWINDRLALLLGVGLAILVVYLLLLALSCVAVGGIVRAVDSLDSDRDVTFGAAWRLGLQSFWRVLRLRLLLLVLMLAPAALLIIPPAVGAGAGQQGLIKGVAIDVPLGFAYVFWAFFVSWLAILALRACVLDGLGATSAIGAGWALLRDDFARVALTGAIFLGAGLVTNIFSGALLAAFSAPFAFNLVRDLQSGDWSRLGSTGLTYLAVILPLSLLVNALTGSYFSAYWTLAYRRFARGGALPVLGPAEQPARLPV